MALNLFAGFERIAQVITGVKFADGIADINLNIHQEAIAAKCSHTQHLTAAHCLAHTRRKFVEAEEQEPGSSKHAVQLVRQIYEKENAAPKNDKHKHLEYRLREIKPIVDGLFDWLELESQRIQGLPSNKYSEAVNYALTRKTSLPVFLTDPEVPLDNNHAERTIRAVVLGRKNYLFCWSEIGAEKLPLFNQLLLPVS